jgi:uncharacterized protein
MTPLRAFKLFPSRDDLLDQFVSLAEAAIEEAALVLDLLHMHGDIADRVRQAKEIEHSADDIVHRIVQALNRTYISEFDVADLHDLASSLDDVIDFTYGAADRVLLYKVTRIPTAAGELVQVIREQANGLAAAVSALQIRDEVVQHCSTVKQLQINAERLANSALAQLFEFETDAIQLIKVKDMFTQLAFATGRAKDAAEVIETMVVNLR